MHNVGKITVSGKDKTDAKPYQAKEVLKAIQEVEALELLVIAYEATGEPLPEPSTVCTIA